MRRHILALALIAGFAFIAAPATADDASTSTSGQPTSTESEQPPETESPDGDKVPEETPAPEESPSAEAPEQTDEPTADAPEGEDEPAAGTPNQASPPEDHASSQDDEEESDGDPDKAKAGEDEVAAAQVDHSANSVEICHKDGAGFTKETIAADSAADGHDDHAADVIPPFEFAGGSYAGKNYDDAGRALLENGCEPAADQVQFAADLQQQKLLQQLVTAAAKKPTVTICHATNSVSNPYVSQNPSADGDVSGHAGHTGPVFQVGFTNKDDWGDIIPPFNINGVSFPGLNWTAAGQAIFNAGCALAVPPPPPPGPGQIAICHATGDPLAPFDPLTVLADAPVSGHASDANDIIPPFNINQVVFPGLNWDATGQAIFNNGCVDPNNTPGGGDTDVTICHANSKLTVTANATASGHAAHAGDIIPPFNANGVSFPGLNWDAQGQKRFGNNCLRTSGGGDDSDDSDDSDSDDSDSDDDSGGLPDAGGAPLWALMLGCTLLAGGVALANNRQLVSATGSAPVPSWDQLLGRPVATEEVVQVVSTAPPKPRDTWTWTIGSSFAIAIAAYLIRNITK